MPNVALNGLNYMQGFMTYFMFQQALMSDDPLNAIVYQGLITDLTPQRTITTYQVKNMFPVFGDACNQSEVGDLTSENILIERRAFPTVTEIDVCAFNAPMFEALVKQAGANTDLNMLFAGTEFVSQLTTTARRNYGFNMTAKRWFADLTKTNTNAFGGMFVDMNGHYANALSSSDVKKVTVSGVNTAFGSGQALTKFQEIINAKSSVAFGQREVAIIGQYFAKSLRADLVATNQNAFGFALASDAGLEAYLFASFGVPVRISKWLDTYYLMSLQTATITPNRDGSYDSLLAGKYPKIAILARVATTEQDSVFLEDWGMGMGEPAYYLRDYKDRNRDGLQLKMRTEIGTGLLNDSAAVITVV